jgi:hypothetical protein
MYAQIILISSRLTCSVDHDENDRITEEERPQRPGLYGSNAISPGKTVMDELQQGELDFEIIITRSIAEGHFQ